MTATIIYSEGNSYQIEVPDDKAALPVTALDYIWEETQRGIVEIMRRKNQITLLVEQGAKLRSSMMGDVFQIGGRSYVVDRVGFQEISAEQLQTYLTVPQIDRVMGWDWVRKRFPIGLHIQTIH